MRRREFITLLGGAGAWPLVASAQPGDRVRRIGVLGTRETRPEAIAAVHRGLSEAGYAEGRNLAVEYRLTAEAEIDRLPSLAADLVRRQVSLIVALQTPAVVAAKAATTTIPVIFATAVNPVESGFVASLNRPGGNLTGITGLIVEVAAKRVELLHELVPVATSIAYLVSPINAAFAEAETKEVQAAARTLGRRLLILKASRPVEFEPAFATIVRERAGGLLVSGSTFFSGYVDQLVGFAARQSIPAIYGRREDAAAGGLISYGTDFPDMYRQVGIYSGRVLNGEQAANLPVQQVTKFELVINMKTAKALGLTIPITLMGRADEVIE